jgi:hypothetical protein
MDTKDMITQFLANGGKIKQYESRGFNASAKYQKDRQLKALRALKRIVTDETDLLEIEKAINVRIEVLKASY